MCIYSYVLQENNGELNGGVDEDCSIASKRVLVKILSVMGYFYASNDNND